MTWKDANLTITRRGKREVRKASVNEYGLYVTKIGDVWQVTYVERRLTADVLTQLAGSLPTRTAARALADKLGPLAPFGWTSKGTDRWLREQPESFAKMERLTR